MYIHIYNIRMFINEQGSERKPSAYRVHFLNTYLSVKPSKIGSTQNETDRTASYERVSIHLKVNALGLKLLNPRQSDQALHFLLVG